jgi:CDP-glucose 4,6-dehydratase
MGGHDPYSSSKGCSELVTSAYRHSFFPLEKYPLHRVALATARAGNVIGGGDWAKDRLVPDILAAFARKEPVVIRNPRATRPWQHVLEPLRGYLVLAEKLHEHGPEYAEAWNFGPHGDDARPVEWIARELAKRWGDGARWQAGAGEHPHEANYLKLDISKAAARLAWQPTLRLQQALDLVVEWARPRQAGTDLRALTLRQIADYQAQSIAPLAS